MEGHQPSKEVNTLTSLIWAVVVILVVLWLLGWSFQVGGSPIFLLLVLAIAGVIYNLVAGGMFRGAQHPHTPRGPPVEHHDVRVRRFKGKTAPPGAFFCFPSRPQICPTRRRRPA